MVPKILKSTWLSFIERSCPSQKDQSLGAKFIKVNLGTTGQTEGGYAKKLTAAQIQKQQ